MLTEFNRQMGMALRCQLSTMIISKRQKLLKIRKIKQNKPANHPDRVHICPFLRLKCFTHGMVSKQTFFYMSSAHLAPA